MLRLLVRFGKFWDALEMFLGGLFLTASVLLIFTEIITRTFFRHSTIGVFEIASFCVIWSVFFTASIAVKKNTHVRVDILPNLLPRRGAVLLDLVGTALVIAFAAYLTYSGIVLVQESYLIGEVTMTTLRTPLWIPQLVMPIGGFLLTVRLLQRALMLVHAFRHNTVPEEDRAAERALSIS